MNKNILKYLNHFKFLDTNIPTAYEIYSESNKAYQAGDLETARKLVRMNYILHTSIIHAACKIGAETSFSIGIIVHKNAKIGERCKIGSNVQIAGDGNGVPRIGNDVYISTGAKIIGKINIGDGAIIGANAVVKYDVDPFTIVAGVPAKKINSVTRENFKKYAGFYYCKNQPELQEVFLNQYFS